MKTVKIIAALLAALLLTGCSVKLTVGTQDNNQPAETAKQVVTVEDIGALVSELQNGHVWMACAESELYSLRIDGSGLTITAYAKQDGSTEKQTLSGTFTADADGVHITDGNGNTVLELTWQLIAEEGDNALQRLEMITKTEGGILPKDVTLEFYSTQATDEAGEDAKLVAVPHSKLSKEYDHIKDVNDLPELLKAQIAHFFEHYKDLEKGKWVKVEGWENAEAAKAEIVASFERAKNK